MLAMLESEHEATRTYQSKGYKTMVEDAGLTFRQVLARDIQDVRSIVGTRYNEGVDRIAEQVGYFDVGVVQLNSPASAAAIAAAEHQLDVRFPPAFRRFLCWHNGGRVVHERIYGVPPIDPSLDLVFDTADYRTLRGPDWPESYVLVGYDGCGNPYVIPTDRVDDRGESPVVFLDGISLEVEFVAGSDYLQGLCVLATVRRRRGIRRQHGHRMRSVARSQGAR